MPVFKKPELENFVDLPPRKGIDAGSVDVLVVGGGPAGLAAAWGAAHAGADVVLVERNGFLGGTATAALVAILASYYTQYPEKIVPKKLTFFPVDHNVKDPVIGGFLDILVEQLVAGGGALSPSEETGHTVPFDPECFKTARRSLMDDAGGRLLFHSFASGILGGSAVEGVIFETKTGPIVVRPKVVVDCTGDGDIAFFAGAPFDVGRKEDNLVQPMTLYFQMVDFARQRFEEYVKANPHEWQGVHGLGELIRKATGEKDLKLPRENILFFGSPNEGQVDINSTRVINVLGTNVWDLTYAEWQSRRQMLNIANFLRTYVPGFEKAYIGQSGATIGVRETRRITGDYKLTGADIVSARKFDDVIARGTYPIDIHNPKGTGTIFQRLPPGEAYDIPLRCLIPLDTENVIVAGRCISGTHEAHASYRVMPICMATGQAAGVCAAVAVKGNKKPRQVSAQEVQEGLVQQGANLRGAVKRPYAPVE
jgi:hypothetical protein